jgi:hypothetical protein
MNTDPTPTPAVAGPVELPVRPYATSVTWRNAAGGSWQQWHDEEDPMPTEWEDRPPNEVVHVYTAAQVADMLAAERERCAKERATLKAAAELLARMVAGDSVTMAACSEMADEIGRSLGPNLKLTGRPGR